MEVFVELVLIDNFAITFLLARLAYLAVGEYPKIWRLVSASTVGAVGAVLNPLISSHILSLCYKIVCGAVLRTILFAFKKPLKGTAFFLIFTFAFGGTLFAIAYMVFGTAEKALTTPLTSLPIGVVLFAVYLLFLFSKRLVFKIRKTRDVKRFLYDATITVFGKTLKCKAFLDSGNRIYDSVSGLPIAIVDISTISKVLSDEQMIRLMSGRIKDFNNAHYIDYSTLGGCSKMLVFAPDELVVYDEDKKNIINEVMLGVTFKRIFDDEKYGLLLSPAIMTGAH